MSIEYPKGIDFRTILTHIYAQERIERLLIDGRAFPENHPIHAATAKAVVTHLEIGRRLGIRIDGEPRE